MIKIVLLTAFLGHVICGITDCMMAYSKSGRFDFSDIKDNDRMKRTFKTMPPRQIELAMMIGVVALFMASLGYVAVSFNIMETDLPWGRVMLVSSLFFSVLISAHHVLCGATQWFYIKFGMSEEARITVMEFFKKTSFVAAAYAGLLIYALVLFILVVTGNTDLPRWACVFNTLPLFLVMAPTKIPAKGNIANAIMFLGLLILI
ncbi:MAG: hypothetical protein IJ869_01560 [Clostridiales bacterium]|nr:hypothetical protein [Clostridiales bacterium]